MFYIKADRGITGDGKTVLAPVYVGVDGDTITYVSDQQPASMQQFDFVDMGDTTLTPGLLNLHDHVNRKVLRDHPTDLPVTVRSKEFMSNSKEYMLLHGVKTSATCWGRASPLSVISALAAIPPSPSSAASKRAW